MVFTCDVMNHGSILWDYINGADGQTMAFMYEAMNYDCAAMVFDGRNVLFDGVTQHIKVLKSCEHWESRSFVSTI